MLDIRITKKTKHRDYFEYMVKWKGHLVDDAIWMNEQDLWFQRFDIVDIQNSSFVSLEFDA